MKIRELLKNQFNTVLTIIIFIGVIAAFTLAGLMKKDRTFSQTENRYLAQKPELSAKEFFSGKYSSEYETYITDQFFMRDKWISLKTVCELGLSKKDINGVYIADDDYLIEMQNDIDEEKAYNNADRMIEFLEEETGLLGDEHVRMMVVPTAVNILRDKLPKYAETFDQDVYIDYIKQQLGGQFVDVRNVLWEHREDYIYYRTDHHWTTYAAFLAYGQYAESTPVMGYTEDEFTKTVVTEDFLGTIYSKINYARKADTISIYEPKDNISYSVDINKGEIKVDSLYFTEHLKTKDKYSLFLDGNNPLVVIENKGARNDGETLMIIKDSYAHCFAPFAANNYKRVVLVDLRYVKVPVTSLMEEYGVTDILVLYNAIHFAQDNNMALLR